MGAFFQALFSPEAFEVARGADFWAYPSGLVCILQMTVATVSFTRPMLLSAFQRQAALVFPPGAYTVDMILPVAEPGTRDRHVYQLTDSKGTGIFVQVKTDRESGGCPRQKLRRHSSISAASRQASSLVPDTCRSS